MTVYGSLRFALKRSLVLLLGGMLLFGGAPGLRAQSPSGKLAGTILDPQGKPAFGFKVVVVDTTTNIKYTSAPTDASGNYSIAVPVGGTFKVDSVVADDGVTRLAVQDAAAVSVMASGTKPLNVRFVASPAPAADTASTEEEKKKKKGAVPWYQRPGPIVGIVLGSVAVAALALSGGSDGNDDNTASRSKP
jgi:hypothetical protein